MNYMINYLKRFIRRIAMIIGYSRGNGNGQFVGSADYWEKRYSSGGNSGVGSYDKFADFKARVLNRFVEEEKISSITELGCGDGNQLNYANYNVYLGVDVSETAIKKCSERFAHKQT